MTATGNVIGTFEYLAPEQIQGGAGDARSDLWALGVLLYETLSGRTPFSAPTVGELYNKISKAQYLPLSGLTPSAPRQLESIIARCLKKSPADRYPSAQELLNDLSRVSDSPPAPKDSKDNGHAFWSAIARRARRLTGAIGTPKRLGAAAGIAAAIAMALVYYFTVFAPLPIETGAKKQVQIEVTEGRAQVYRGGEFVGATPCRVEARVGEEIDLTLKSEGYVDKSVQFSVTENKKIYTFTMRKGE
jgi:hypothetical protein